jgi:hypothetical protein
MLLTGDWDVHYIKMVTQTKTKKTDHVKRVTLDVGINTETMRMCYAGISHHNKTVKGHVNSPSCKIMS